MPKPIKDRGTMTDNVCEYMSNHCRALSIDALLARPVDAMRMGIDVAIKQQRISAKTAKAIVSLLDQIVKVDPNAVDAIDEVCRAALAARKRGDLKRDRY